MVLSELYGNVKYLLGGGVLPLLSRSLAEVVDRAVLFQPQGDDLYVVDAFGTTVDPVVRGGAARLKGRLPRGHSSPAILALDESDRALFPGGWRALALLGDGDDVVAVLLAEPPGDEMTSLLASADGLVRLWRRYVSIDDREKTLASLSYLLYAAKSAFPSIFEPLPPDDLVLFLVDVLRESFAPRRLTLIRDDGGILVAVAGDEGPLPSREGLFAARNLSAVPVPLDDRHGEVLGRQNLDRLSPAYSVVLPLFGGDRRFFFLLQWGNVASEEASFVLELMGGVTARAMAVNALREERERQIAELSEREFSLRALRQAMRSLMGSDSVDSLVGSLLDGFAEMSQSRQVLVVLHDEKRGGYGLAGRRSDGVSVSADLAWAPCGQPFSVPPLPSVSTASAARRLFGDLGLPDPPREILPDETDRLFYLTDGSILMGFVALAPSVTAGRYGDDENLETLAVVAAGALRRCRCGWRT